MATNSVRLAQLITWKFLIPGVGCSNHHDKWKLVNRAAGIITGFAVTRQRPIRTVENVLTQIESMFKGTAERETINKGLRERIAEILVQLEIDPKMEGR